MITDECTERPLLVHTERSSAQTLYVYDFGGLRFLTFSAFGDKNALGQSVYRLEAPDTVERVYARSMVAAAATHPAPSRALMLGVGGGVIPKALLRVFADLHIDAVDCDAGVLRVAQDFFGLRCDHRLGLHAMDARAFVRQACAAGMRYDLILLDVYDHHWVPAHLSTVEFFCELRSALAPGGLLCTNWCKPPDEPLDGELATQALVFGSLAALETPGNFVVLSARDGLPPLETLRETLRGRAGPLSAVGIGAASQAECLGPLPPWDRAAEPLFDPA